MREFTVVIELHSPVFCLIYVNTSRELILIGERKYAGRIV